MPRYPLKYIALAFLLIVLFVDSFIRTPPTNASGLTPAESKALKSRRALPHEEEIIQSIQEMYSCNPKDDTFSIYTEGAVFHDPIGYAEGAHSIRSQFVGLAKIFDHADFPKFRILDNPPSVPSNIILIDQDVSYFRKESASSPTKTINSLLTLETNEHHQVTRHTEEWDHKRQTTRKDGLLGFLNEVRKRVTAELTDIIVGRN